MNDDIPVFPLAGWELKEHKELPLLMFQPHFISSLMQPLDQPTVDRLYVLTPAVARELGEKLVACAARLEKRCESADGHMLQ
jgi:hypothetical protein